MVTRSAKRKQQGERREETKLEEDKTTEKEKDDDSDTTVVTRGSRKKMSEEEMLMRGLKTNEEDDREEKITADLIEWTKTCISESWIKLDNYVDYIAFIPYSKRLPTKFWFATDETLRKTNPGYTVKEIQYAKQGILNTREDAKKLFKVDDDRKTVGKIARKMAKSVQRKEYKENSALEKFVLLFIRMAGTEEYILDDAGFLYDDLKKIKEMWIIGQQIFGNTCDTNEKKISEFQFNEEGKESEKESWIKWKDVAEGGFKREDFMDVNGEHPWKILEDVNVNSGLKQMCSSVEEWELAVVMNLTEEQPNETQKKNIEVMIKLAKTHPSKLPGWNKEKSILDLNPFSMAWIAVHNTLGITWKKEVKWDEKSIGTNSTATIHPKRVKKKAKTNSQMLEENKSGIASISNKTEKVDWFVERENKIEETVILDQTWNRPRTTFFKVRLPPTPKRDNEEFNQQDLNERVDDFLKFLEAVWEADPSSCLPTWYRKVKKEPLHSETPQTVDREFLKPYVSYFYTTTSRGGSYIRFKLRHTNSVEEIINHPALEWQADKKHIYLYEDKIQAVQVMQAGWLAGSINSRGGIRDLESILKNHPFAKLNRVDNLEIRISQIIIDAIDRKAPETDRVFAMHVYTDKASTGAVRELCQMIYPADPQPDYPMGRHMRFIPNVSDSRFIRPPEAKVKARQLRDRQRMFLKSIKSTETSDILQLNRALKTPPYPSLMQVLTTWKSKDYPEENLFAAVEESAEDVKFFYLEKNEEQAEALIPLLGIILENEFGPSVWSWFTHNCKVTNQSFTYEKETRTVTNNSIKTSKKAWNLGIASNTTGVSISPSFQVDIGEIKLLQAERGRPLDDASIETMGFGRGKLPTITQEKEAESNDESTITASLVTRKNPEGWDTDNDTINGFNKEDDATIQGGLVDSIPQELKNKNVEKNVKTDGKVGVNIDDDDNDEVSTLGSTAASTNKKADTTMEKASRKSTQQSRNTMGEDESTIDSIITRKKISGNNNGNDKKEAATTKEATQKDSDLEMNENEPMDLSDDNSSVVTRKKERNLEENKKRDDTINNEKDTANPAQKTSKRKMSANRRTKVRARLKAKAAAVVSPLKRASKEEKQKPTAKEDENTDSDEYDERDKLPIIEWVRMNKQHKSPTQNEKSEEEKNPGEEKEQE